MASLIPLDVIANNITSGKDIAPRYKFTILRHLLSGWRELTLFVTQEVEEFHVKTEIMEFDNIITLPCDYIYETKVGILMNGRLAVLSLDKSIQKEIKLNQSQSEEVVNSIFCGEYSGSCYPFYNCHRRGNFLGEMYGWGRGVHAPGYYNIDRKAGEMYIGSLVPKGAEIVLEYKSDGISEGLKLVPSEAEMCLSYWAKARFWEENGDLGKAQYNNNEYDKHYFRLKRLYNFQSALYMSAEINEMFSPTNY
jgi:hypothetical protein